MRAWKKGMTVLLAAGLLAGCLLAAGCGKPADAYQPYRDRISELRNVFYGGESEHFEVEVYAGRREDPFRADGVAESTEPFFLILVFPKLNLERKDLSVSFEADRLYQAKLIKNPAFDSYAYDFGKVERLSGNFNLEVSCENFIEEVTLLRMSAEFESEWESALKSGVDLFHEKEDWQQRETEGFEIGVRLVRDRERNGKLSWHFVMVFTDGTVWGKIFPCETSTENEENHATEQVS